MVDPQTPSTTTVAAGSDTAPASATSPAAKLNPAERIADFERVILKSKEYFSFGGTVPLDEIDPRKMAIYYSADMEDSHILRFPPSENQLAHFYEKASPSPFGKNQEEVFDDAYRRAKEYKRPHVALSDDLVLQSSVLTILADNLLVTGLESLEAKLSRVNVYGTGGFFKQHRDTPRGLHHVGTITFCLPSTFAGGELVVNQDNTEVVFDWSRSKGGPSLTPTTPSASASPGLATPDESTDGDATPPIRNNLITWAYLYSDCLHEVLPVTSGTRITVTYDIWCKPIVVFPLVGCEPDVNSNPIKECLLSLLCDEEHFLPEGGRIAFGTRHGYPVARQDQNLQHLLNSFKGKDAVLVGLLNLLELKWVIVAVYNAGDDWRDDDRSEAERVRVEDVATAGTDPYVVNVQSVGRRYDLLTGDDFWVASDGMYESAIGYEIVQDKLASIDKDVIWVTQPGEYGHENGYVAYGNEPCAEILYIGVGIMVTIPPAAERKCFASMRVPKRSGPKADQ